MRINSFGYNSIAAQRVHRDETKKSNGFNEAFTKQTVAQKTEGADTITITASKPSVVATESKEIITTQEAISTANKVANAASNPVINPTDSTEVKLEKLREIATNADYTGMSDAEIYKTIWNRYNDAFDGNMAAIQINAYPGAASKGNWVGINEQFLIEAGKLGVTSREVRDEVMGFAGMSHEERETEILRRYEGKNTTLDFLNMTGELWLSGVLTYRLGDGVDRTYLNTVRSGLLSTGDPLRPELSATEWSDRLSSKLDVGSFLKSAFASLLEQNPHLAETLEPIDDFINELIEHQEKMQGTQPEQNSLLDEIKDSENKSPLAEAIGKMESTAPSFIDIGTPNADEQTESVENTVL